MSNEEWSDSNKWNPFNSYKLLAHTYRWRLIGQGRPLPQPALVTVDPVNLCNLSCCWCNADYILQERNNQIDRKTLLEIARGLAAWQGSPDWPAGVEAVCIAGGGEPLLHPHIGEFITECVKKDIEVGVVTNGVLLDKFIEPLSQCTWVGVSVDAGSPATFEALKGKDLFHRVCANIRQLCDFSRKKPCRLGLNRPGYGVSYKYLLHPENINDIVQAAHIAKESGCKNFHLRPAGIAWNQIGKNSSHLFTPNLKTDLDFQLEEARKLEDKQFGVFGITHKFNSLLNRSNRFDTCHAIFMTAVFMPPRIDRNEKFCVSTCCDRRGDKRLEFSQPMIHFNDVTELWGGQEHWHMQQNIDVAHCPRCTYQPHNQIFEHVILNDSMTYKFI